MADVSLDKTDPQIKHIRPITDDLITKFQLERPIILAYKVWTPQMPFTLKTVAYSLTQIAIPYDIQSITGIWYYKYTDIMDDDQRFVRETVMEKGDPVVGYRIYPCETYDGIEYCYNYIYFDIPLTSRKIWIEGVGKAEGYIEANESTLEPMGEFKLHRYNVYSISQQRVIPDSGSKILPYNSANLRVYWKTTSTSTSSPDNGEWRGPDVCHCREESDIYHHCWDYPVVSGSIEISQSIGTRNIRFLDTNNGERFTYSYQYGNWVNDIMNRTETCHDFTPDYGNTTYRKDRTSETWSTNGIDYYWNYQGVSCGTYSPNHPERWIAPYYRASSLTKYTFTEQSSGRCTCGMLGAICWGGCDCDSGSYQNVYTNTGTWSGIINIGGTERVLGTGQTSDYQTNSMVCADDKSTYDYGAGPQYHQERIWPIASYAVQKKKFETEDTTDALMGKFYYRREIVDYAPSGNTTRTEYPSFLTVFKLDENGLAEKNWSVDFNSYAEFLGTMIGLETNFDLTYVRL